MEFEKIIKERRIPTKGQLLVKLESLVEPTTVIAKGTVPSVEIEELKLDQTLNVVPEYVSNHLIKHKGELVKRNEVIAIARSFFGRKTRVAQSPIDGSIESFSSSTGRMLIRGHPIPVQVNAHIPGKVTEIFQGEGAIVETLGVKLNGIFGVGGENHGTLVMAVDSPNRSLTRNQIKPEHKGMILIGGSLVTLEALREAERIGVKGIIVGGIEQKDLTYFLGHEIGVAITGRENIELTLIITEGFGEKPIQSEKYHILNQHSGSLACIDGTTHIRSRVLRPEIIIPG
jgi:hypothetical protein